MNSRKLKNNKAEDENEMCAEMWKWDITTTANILHPLFTKIWEEEKVPESWRRALMIYLFKKGNSEETGNFRGISLLDIGSKIFTFI